ncbi:LuxR C-terminal-related transcriptional regulator [Sphingomonas citri]|jgi:two-component system, NarL family, nitrate/nitrite response regulator NarL|uniref:Response regulator transcription factor n=1 Tax=Sphingomonas citri TaxID=2862499 RepID=A0ABS7BT52_9SPHN|nr:response regulator transcription factor [Sphingomonas citri]MBW6532787.1 response regulator transcription factor [Sphingomonas citri]
MSGRIGLLIVSPNEIEGEGLRRLLGGERFDVIGVARSCAAACDAAVPDLVLLRAPPGEATGMCRDARARWPQVRLAVMARACESAAVAEAIQAGADGYLSIETSVAGLTEMLKLIVLGEKLVPSQVVNELASLRLEAATVEPEIDLGDVNVSERELEILQGLIQGEPNKVISRRLSITEATVKVHVKSILRKLHVLNRTQAAVWALSRGLAQPSDGAVSPRVAAAAEPRTRDRAPTHEMQL